MTEKVQPLISVIVPVYNVEKYIKRCVESIMRQTFTDGIECILINDASPDKSIQIIENLIEEYKGNIQFRILSHTKNKGVVAARQTGINEASGKYLSFLDSDDYIEPDMLHDFYKEIERSKADIIIADYITDTEKGSTYHRQQARQLPKEALSDILTDKLPAFIWNKLYKRELFLNKDFHIPENINMGEDLIMNVIAFYHARKIAYINKAYIHYRRENEYSFCNTIDNNKLESQKNSVDVLEGFFSDKDDKMDFYVPFMEAKNRIKTAILVMGDNKLRKKYQKIFPEANKYIFNYDVRSFKQKLLLYLNSFSPLLFRYYMKFSSVKNSIFKSA